jgi:hypothetical protein
LALQDADGDAMSVTVKAGGTTVASAQNLRSGTHALFATVGALPPGEHRLSVEVSDGRTTTTRVADVPIIKLPAGSGVSAPQIQAAERIFQWAQSLIGPLLGAGSASSMNPACPQAIPGSYGRFYASTQSCLLVLDGLVAYSLNGQPLSVAGNTDGLLTQAAAAGF